MFKTACQAVLAAFGTAMAIVTVAAGTTAVAAAPVPVEPVLAPDAAVTAILEKLGDNCSAILPAVKVVGDPGPLAKPFKMDKHGPGGRDYSIKMVWMPDRQRAFYCGANHGASHRLNDAWEYDLPSNSWVVLYPADYNDYGKVNDSDKDLLEVKDGWLRSKNGGPGHPAHTWWGLTYDQELKAILWFCQWPSYRLKAKLDLIGASADQLYKGPSLWAFYLEKKKWEPAPTPKPWPNIGYAGALEYVPELTGSIWKYEGTWLLDSKTLAWKNIAKSKECPWGEAVVCYDSIRKLLIAHRAPIKDGGPYCTWQMATTGDELGKWNKVLEAPDLPDGYDARSMLYFDPVGKVGLLYEIRTRAIWAYDPDKTAWTKLKPEGPPPPETSDAGPVGYFDPARNVFVVNMGTVTWVYRFKRVG